MLFRTGSSSFGSQALSVSVPERGRVPVPAGRRDSSAKAETERLVDESGEKCDDARTECKSSLVQTKKQRNEHKRQDSEFNLFAEGEMLV